MKVAERAVVGACCHRKSGPRVLMSAYQCGPGMGSVSQIGWEWYRRMSARVPVTLVTHVRNREALAAAGAPVEGSEVIYIDTEWFAGPIYRVASRIFPKSQHAVFLMSSLDFYVYDAAALGELRRRQKFGANWDLVHAVTPVSPLASTRLYRLGLPLVLGPWNGGLRSPANFPEIMKQDSGWVYPVRNLGRLVDRVLGGSRGAAVILSATRETRESLPAACRSRCMEMLENGVDLERFNPSAWPFIPGRDGALRVVFVGRLIPAKGIPMLLEAARRFRTEAPIQVRIVGDGPMETEWRKLAADLILSGEVEFCGPATLAEVPRHLAWAHVFCLPSVRESGGAVLIEAMAAARPVVAVDYGGPSELVDDHVGKAIPPLGKDTVIEGLVETFRDIIRHPGAWQLRGQEGRRRAENRFGWDAKIGQALGLYERLLQRTL